MKFESCNLRGFPDLASLQKGEDQRPIEGSRQDPIQALIPSAVGTSQWLIGSSIGYACKSIVQGNPLNLNPAGNDNPKQPFKPLNHPPPSPPLPPTAVSFLSAYAVFASLTPPLLAAAPRMPEVYFWGPNYASSCREEQALPAYHYRIWYRCLK